MTNKELLEWAKKKKAYLKAYRQKPEVRAYHKAYNQKPKIKVRRKAYYKQNREKILAYTHAYYLNVIKPRREAMKKK
jgi:hypothetical protein